MLSDFDKYVKQRNELKSWYTLGGSVTKYDNKNHSLSIRIHGLEANYCGQAYAGAQNYHEAPKFFVENLIKEFVNQGSNIAKIAYEKEIERLNNLIEGYKADILKELENSGL